MPAFEVGREHWLSEGRALDIPFDHDPKQVLERARRHFADQPVDVNVVRAANRRKKLLIADMDSTIINCECLDELADMAGLKPIIAEITERAMRGELDFAEALRRRVAMLKGLDLSALGRVYDERIRLDPGAKSLVATMKKHGAHTMLVSGGFSFYTHRVAQAAGFDMEQANVLLHDGKVLTGEVANPILGREAKLAALEEAVAKLGIHTDDAVAVGDGANDLAMIGRAGLGVAYRAKPVVAEAAGASVSHGDLTALLYLQGYSDSEIVRPD
ncbi:MAG: phosphoserine phosphatase SerB [Alphaproteobacteria bacterium]|nr:phosphoserine phosphatase SerB [Alphaproteobacteria bacterium]MBV9421162.1 phosphoserine phosphatase SerB [Alphaproteobacteria bacterium]MBV9541132.1 phosphoserine phosphatase SerB [Alphaproteobacteria bacterium]MBV9903773.1 phosphoserine phosphatase SerB [Alphaproteobacteria bacterium]